MGTKVSRENTFFRETGVVGGVGGPRIGVLTMYEHGHKAPHAGVRPLGYYRGTMWVPWWVSQGKLVF